MSPSEIRAALTDVDARLGSTVTAATALAVFGVVALAFGLIADDGFARTCAAVSALGALGAVGVSRFLVWRRTDLYDEILLAGYRHVEEERVARREALLVSAGERRQLASTLETFLECARNLRPAAVPLTRRGLRLCDPLIRGLVDLLRDERILVRARGMVLLHRLLSDGATSPLFEPAAAQHDRALTRALEDIVTALAGRAEALRLAALTR